MNFTLIPNFSGNWSNTAKYAATPLFGVEPLSYLSPTVIYSGNLYIANYTNGVNPPVGAVPGVSATWTLLAEAGSGVGVSSITSTNGTIVITNPSGPVTNISTNLAIKSTAAPYTSVVTDRIVQITNSGTVTMGVGAAALSGNPVTIVALGGNVTISATGLSSMVIPTGWSMSFYYNSGDSAWHIYSAAVPAVQNITSTDNSLTVTRLGNDVDVSVNNAEVIVNATSTLSPAFDCIYVNTTGTTQTLPLGSTVTPFKSYRIFNGNIATTAVAPQSPDLLNGAGSSINIVGAYNEMTFTFSPTQGWRAK